MKTLFIITFLFFALPVRSDADAITFEGVAPKGGAVNINPTLSYAEDGFTLTPSDTESAVFDSAAGAKFSGDSTSWFGFAAGNTLTLTGPVPFNLDSVLAGPSSAGYGIVDFTVVGNLVGGGTVSVTFKNLTTATPEIIGFMNLRSVLFSATGDAGLDNIAVSNILAPVTITPANVTVPGTAASGSFTLQTAVTGFAWSAASDSPWLTITAGGTGSGPGTIQYAIAANSTGSARTGHITIAGETFTITQTSLAVSVLGLSPGSVQFGAASGGKIVSSPQTVEVTVPAGAGWIASANSSFISVSPSSGTGSGSFTVTVIGGALPLSGSVTGQVAVAASSVSNSPQVLNVSAMIVTNSQIIGSFDTPVNNTSGVAGAVPVTGWALDSIEVKKVDIWREGVGGEGPGLVYIGDAVFVAGARPDVEAAYSNLPFKNRAGWGYLMLSNFLPNNGGSPGLGNGTYRLHAIAHNVLGASVDLGTKTIICDNAHATKPFGTIDTPGQGATVSGTIPQFGWALTQNPYVIPTDGSSITVTVDGVMLGHPVYNNYRQDIHDSFPGYANSGGAVGYFYLDTTTLTNGVHTIGWLAYDNAGRGDGLGSRFFTVLNSGQAGSLVQPSLSRRSQGVKLRRGYDLTRKLESLAAGPDGTYSVGIKELGRIEMNVGAAQGSLDVNGETRALPVGSTLKDGVFYWQLGPGFLGLYRLEFVRSDGSIVLVRITVSPKTQASHSRTE